MSPQWVLNPYFGHTTDIRCKRQFFDKYRQFFDRSTVFRYFNVFSLYTFLHEWQSSNNCFFCLNPILIHLQTTIFLHVKTPNTPLTGHLLGSATIATKITFSYSHCRDLSALSPSFVTVPCWCVDVPYLGGMPALFAAAPPTFPAGLPRLEGTWSGERDYWWEEGGSCGTCKTCSRLTRG